MNRAVCRIALVGATVLSMTSVLAAQQTQQSLDDEIAQANKDLVQTQQETQRVAAEIQKDQTDYAAYRAHQAQKVASANADLDSAKKQLAVQTRGNDSLSSVISHLQGERRQVELSEDEFRVQLVGIATKVMPMAKKQTPLVTTQIQSALSLLISDLSSKAVDNVEGCTRLITIINKMEDVTTSIQTASEASPVPDIHGQVFRLRIGAFFEAVVDEKGEKCAVFQGYSADGSPKWKVINSAATATDILKAVSIRDGKSLPSFANLPLAAQAEAQVQAQAAAPVKGGSK